MRLVGTLSLFVFVCVSPVRAVLVDWSTLTWTPGSLSNSFDVDPANPGNDFTATVSGDTAQMPPAILGGEQTPAITPHLEGGFGAGHMSLQLGLNLTSNAQSITVTIDFSGLYVAGASNVSFNLFDIDFANTASNTYQDVISNIHATSTTGTLIAPTITGSVNNTVTGSGLNQIITGMTSTSDTGATSADGNATISFNTTDIGSITFTYGSSGAFADPTYQHIALDNLLYTVVVPEFNPTWITFVVCGAIVGISTRQHLLKRRKTGKK